MQSVTIPYEHQIRVQWQEHLYERLLLASHQGYRGLERATAGKK